MTDVAEEPKPPSVPSFEELLVTPIFESEQVNPTTSYGTWPVDHANAHKFYVVGRQLIERDIGEYQATFYRALGERAREFIQAQTNWALVGGGSWNEVPAYNQFRRAAQDDALNFDRACYVIAAHAVAHADWVARQKSAGIAGSENLHPLGCFATLGILPACYNIDGFTSERLEMYRSGHANFDDRVAAASGQRDARLLDDMVAGKCVTLRTAARLRDAVNELVGPNAIGPVCGRPGRQRGRREASAREVVDLHAVRGSRPPIRSS